MDRLVCFSKTLFPNLREFPVQLPRFYGGVVLVGAGSFCMHMFLAYKVVKARKEIDFTPPDMYHPTNRDFNCIQRSHQNYLESLPLFLMGLFAGGLYCPVGAIVLGTITLFGRYDYYVGYTSGDPANRSKGKFGLLSFMGLMLLTTMFGAAHLVASCRAVGCCH